MAKGYLAGGQDYYTHYFPDYREVIYMQHNDNADKTPMSEMKKYSGGTHASES